SSAQNIIIVDESKISEMLGENWALPIEVVPFALSSVQRFLEALSAEAPLRRAEDGKPFVTDQGNWIVDASMGPMVEAQRIAQTLNQRAGIVEHGLFIGLATKVVVATADGIREMEQPGK
ncbi:MAG: ribose-5-phosphate isomerase A, partial [Calditrichota bacterium]